MKESGVKALGWRKSVIFPYIVALAVILLLILLGVDISALILALAATVLLIVFYIHRTNRQKKALILLFAKEFMMLFDRCTGYYEQMLQGAQSFSTLFEISDSATVVKLGEVGIDISIIETIMILKADFFQVIRWAHMATKIDPTSQELIMDSGSRNRAIAFFVGGTPLPDGSFGRVEYRKYKERIDNVLDYLEKINSEDFDLGKWLPILSNFREQRKALEDFVKKSKEDLNGFEKKLGKLRLEEKKR